MEFEIKDTVLIGKVIDVDVDVTEKVVAFDLDHTIIKPLNNKKFSKSYDDWDFAYPNIIEKLKMLEKDYKIVFLSNQRYVSFGVFNFIVNYQMKNINWYFKRNVN
jgi:DNA 3'-phosphatase